MKKLLKAPKKLIIITSFLFIAALVILNVVKKNTLPKVTKDVLFQESPTLGDVSSPIHIVVFEEPACKFCKEFNEYIFPDIKKTYIDKGIASYSLIITSFFPGSDLAAEALLCIYNASSDKPDSDLFFEYLDLLFSVQGEEGTHWITVDLLLSLLDKMKDKGNLTKDKLKKCLESRIYSDQVKKNNRYGAKLMNGELATPTMFINGIMLDDISFESVSRVIAKLLEKKEEKSA